MIAPQDDREEFDPDVDDGGTSTSPDKGQADDESAVASPEESAAQAMRADADDEAAVPDGTDELAPEESESIAAPADRGPDEEDEAESVESAESAETTESAGHEADEPASDPVEAEGEPNDSAAPVTASADSAGSGSQSVESVDSGESVDKPAESGTGGPAPAEREPGGADAVEPAEAAGSESDAAGAESVESVESVEPTAGPEEGATGSEESGAESVEPVEPAEPTAGPEEGATESESDAAGAESAESAESVEPGGSELVAESESGAAGAESVEPAEPTGTEGQQEDSATAPVESHEEREPVVDEGVGTAPSEPVTEPDAAGSVPQAVEPDAGITTRGLAADAADASAPLLEAVPGAEEPDARQAADVDDPDAGAEEPGAEGESIDLPPSYPPTRRPRPLPIPGREKEEDSSEARPRRGWVSTVAVVLIVLALSAFIKTHIVQTFEIPSGSMENTLQSDDQVAVRMYRAHDVHRGDIVVFADPGGWLNTEDPSGIKGVIRDGLILTGLLPKNSGHHLIKRVIGVAGDRITADGHNPLTVNGVPLNETYVKEGTAPSSVPFDVIVPEGCIWVMGDNRSNSLDSRFHQDDPHGGAVPLKDVVGVATNVVWPVSRWDSLDNGEAVFADVSGSGP